MGRVTDNGAAIKKVSIQKFELQLGTTSACATGCDARPSGYGFLRVH